MLIYRCHCGAKLINHFCGGCNVLNREGIQAYCPECETHPMNPIPSGRWTNIQQYPDFKNRDSF
ncbi:hypothetical protein [Nitrosopumilus sp.]|uniref:hypothetical protein n=1 Tax=Nitrosopumilus sp. TaxID=2024843 RepID=UPI003B5CC05F